MAEPPRLSAILLSWDKSVIYFVTVCVKDRRKVLANQVVFEAIKQSIAGMRKWRVLAGVIILDFINEATPEGVSFAYSDRAPIQGIGVGGI
jgi:hypothetical protein